MAAFLPLSALVLAAEWVGSTSRPDDDVIAAGLTVWLVAFVAGTAYVALSHLAAEHRTWHEAAEARFAPTLERARVAAAAAPGGLPDWAQRDVDTGPGLVDPQVAYTGDPVAAVDAIFAAKGLPPLRAGWRWVAGRAPAPRNPAETMRDLDHLRTELADPDRTGVFPVVTRR